MKNLVLSSFLVTVLTGCSYTELNSFQATSVPGISLNDVKPWFIEGPDHYLYHADIDIYHNHFGGMMVLKFMSKESCRVVYITEIGIKIFDMEFFANGDFKLHYCLDVINRKIVIKTLKNDIGLMLANIPSNNNIKLSQDLKQDKTLLKSTGHQGTKYYLLDNKSLRIEEILTRKSLQKKVEIRYFYNQSELDSVRIKHYNIRLNIHLSRINETKSDVTE